MAFFWVWRWIIVALNICFADAMIKKKITIVSNIYKIESAIPALFLLCQLLVSCSESKAFAQVLFCTFHSCEKVRINYNSILKKKCTTYISLLSFEEVLSTLYFSAVWRMMMIWDDQSDGPIMNDTDRDDLVGKSSTSVPTLTSLQCHPWFIPIVPGMRGMALEWGKDMNVRLSERNSYFITN